ncbi:hypothetical protein CY35_02G148900 [Sphagnum magellanicum]|nr:hypothetical protein CY35_02G148900 [Sphagnum magellanicum]
MLSSFITSLATRKRGSPSLIDRCRFSCASQRALFCFWRNRSLDLGGIATEISCEHFGAVVELDLDFWDFCLQPARSSDYFLMDTLTAQAAGASNPPCCPFVPLCFECGTRRNPCHCRVLGPTIGFVAFALAAVVEWPVGALVYCFRHLKGRRIMAHPAAVVYPRVASCFPI